MQRLQSLGPFVRLDPHEMADLARLQERYALAHAGIADDDAGLSRRSVAGGVEGAVPTGTFRARTMKADLDERPVTLEGNARLRMTPGKLRIPQ